MYYESLIKKEGWKDATIALFLQKKYINLYLFFFLLFFFSFFRHWLFMKQLWYKKIITWKQ